MREVLHGLIAELVQHEHDEQHVDAVQEERHPLEQPLDRVVAEGGERADAGHQQQRADQRRPAEHGCADRAGRRAEHGEDQHHEHQVGDLEDERERPEQRR